MDSYIHHSKMALPTRDKRGFYTNPHVFILGAGASRAAFPNGDRNGKKLPLMADLVTTLELEQFLSSRGIPDPSNSNFEAVYSQLFEQGDQAAVDHLNKVVYEYFDDMELPDEPTIYDQLVLCLRDKDLIATFNWDPLLFKAYMRNLNAPGSKPLLAFLHGNVGLSVCYQDKVSDFKYANRLCNKCELPLQNAPLLYPVNQKNYTENELIQTQWDIVRDNLRRAYMVTIFGYSAPSTDSEAVKLFDDAWQDNRSRMLGSFTIIDNPDLDTKVVEERWERFSTKPAINTVGALSDYRHSRVFHYPRRSCESLGEATLQQNPMRENMLPNFDRLEDLQNWFTPLIQEEML